MNVPALPTVKVALLALVKTGAAAVVVISRLQLVMLPPASPVAVSSRTYRLQVPFGLMPLNLEAKVSGPAPFVTPPGLPSGAGAGDAKVSCSVPSLVGLKVPVDRALSASWPQRHRA